MFSHKCFVVFISKQSIDTGFVSLGKEITFEGREAFAYTEETLKSVFQKIQQITRKKIRIVLSEELVYTTFLPFPRHIEITRELIREKMEEFVPENLKQTQWDFQTLQYKKSDVDENIFIQGVVVERTFATLLQKALSESLLPVESIIPESYALARLEENRKGVFMIIERDREAIVFAVIENGYLIASHTKKDKIDPQDIATFIDFLASYKEKKVEKIIFSHFEEEEMALFTQHFQEKYSIEKKDYNPLVGAGLQKNVSGKDEETLNIFFSFPSSKKAWWKIW